MDWDEITTTPDPSAGARIWHPDLARRLERALDDHLAYRADAAARVVRWRWATGPTVAHEPYEHERDGRRGRWLKSPPAERHGRLEYGFDDAGRVVVVREWSQYTRGCHEEFFRPSADGLDSILFHLVAGRMAAGGERRLAVRTRRFIQTHGRVSAIETVTPVQRLHQRFVYDGEGRAVRMECTGGEELVVCFEHRGGKLLRIVSDRADGTRVGVWPAAIRGRPG